MRDEWRGKGREGTERIRFPEKFLKREMAIVHNNSKGVRNLGDIGRKSIARARRISKQIEERKFLISATREQRAEYNSTHVHNVCVSCGHPVHSEFVSCWLCECRGVVSSQQASLEAQIEKEIRAWKHLESVKDLLDGLEVSPEPEGGFSAPGDHGPDGAA
jgi:hypothetical protein